MFTFNNMGLISRCLCEIIMGFAMLHIATKWMFYYLSQNFVYHVIDAITNTIRYSFSLIFFLVQRWNYQNINPHLALETQSFYKFTNFCTFKSFNKRMIVSNIPYIPLPIAHKNPYRPEIFKENENIENKLLFLIIYLDLYVMEKIKMAIL